MVKNRSNSCSKPVTHVCKRTNKKLEQTSNNKRQQQEQCQQQRLELPELKQKLVVLPFALWTPSHLQWNRQNSVEWCPSLYFHRTWFHHLIKSMLKGSLQRRRMCTRMCVSYTYLIKTMPKTKFSLWCDSLDCITNAHSTIPLSRTHRKGCSFGCLRLKISTHSIFVILCAKGICHFVNKLEEVQSWKLLWKSGDSKGTTKQTK